ncbi:MAG: hypothetical protein ACK5MP_04775 [Nostocoides sp.]
MPSASLFGVWGVFWIIGYLAMWWSVKDQPVYTGPHLWAIAITGALGAIALAVTIVVVTGAVRGISGDSVRAGMYYSLTWPIAFVAAQLLVGGLARLDASDEVLGLVAALLPALVVAPIYCVSAAIWGQPAFFIAGALLAGSVAVGAFLGPVDALLAIALIGGLGSVLATAMTWRSG